MTTTQNTIERKMQLRQTRAMIEAQPLMVILHRTTQVKNARLGLEQVADGELEPQKVRILHAPPRRRRKENTPPDAALGEIPFAKDTLMGMPDLDVQKDDWFEILDERVPTKKIRYTVTYVFWDKDYETIANLATTDQ